VRLVLADTSAWIAHQRKPDPVIVDAMRSGRLCSHGVVIGELSLGCGDVPRRMSDEASRLPTLPDLPAESVRDFGVRHGLSCTGLGWSDACLLASAAASGVDVTIHTRDRSMSAAAARLGLGPAAG